MIYSHSGESEITNARMVIYGSGSGTAPTLVGRRSTACAAHARPLLMTGGSPATHSGHCLGRCRISSDQKLRRNRSGRPSSRSRETM
jgi:hypothetical protein